MKAVGLLSGGIDSPVALYLMKERGCEVIPAYFDNRPFSGEDTRQRAIDLARQLGFKEIYIMPNGENLRAFSGNCERRFTCVFCKRMMLRLAEKLAERLGAEALVTGESLGQVASQTSSNLAAETAAVSIPIIRPLIGFNKEETTEIARRIGTLPTSIRRVTCCSAVPDKPATSATAAKVEAEEKKLDVQALLENSLAGLQRVPL